jgi:hypothetical protein
MTLNEINNVLETVNAEIEQAKTELREIEVAGIAGSKETSAHNKVTAKLAILETRKTELEASLPQAEFEGMKATVAEAFSAQGKAADEYRKIEAEVRAILTPLLHFTLEDAVNDARPVEAAFQALSKAKGVYEKAYRLAREFGTAHKIDCANL